MAAHYRKISVNFWNDAKVGALGNDARYILLFMLSHPYMTSLGLLRHTPQGLAAELGMPQKRFAVAFRRIEEAGVMVQDKRCPLIFFPNFLKYNQPENTNVIVNWKTGYRLMPESPLAALALINARKILRLKDEARDRDGKSYVEVFNSQFGSIIDDYLAACQDEAGSAPLDDAEILARGLGKSVELAELRQLRGVSANASGNASDNQPERVAESLSGTLPQYNKQKQILNTSKGAASRINFAKTEAGLARDSGGVQEGAVSQETGLDVSRGAEVSQAGVAGYAGHVVRETEAQEKARQGNAGVSRETGAALNCRTEDAAEVGRGHVAREANSREGAGAGDAGLARDSGGVQEGAVSQETGLDVSRGAEVSQAEAASCAGHVARETEPQEKARQEKAGVSRETGAQEKAKQGKAEVSRETGAALNCRTEDAAEVGRGHISRDANSREGAGATEAGLARDSGGVQKGVVSQETGLDVSRGAEVPQAGVAGCAGHVVRETGAQEKARQGKAEVSRETGAALNCRTEDAAEVGRGHVAREANSREGAGAGVSRETGGGGFAKTREFQASSARQAVDMTLRKLEEEIRRRPDARLVTVKDCGQVPVTGGGAENIADVFMTFQAWDGRYVLNYGELELYCERWPDLDAPSEFRHMARYLEERPDARPKLANFEGFIGRWLFKANKRPGGSRGDAREMRAQREAMAMRVLRNLRQCG